MASGHLHSVKLDNDKYYHLFNLSYMNSDEISVLQSLLNSKPIDQTRLAALGALKQAVEEIIDMAIVRDKPEAERIDFAAEAKALQDAEVKDADAEEAKDVEVIKKDDKK